MFVGKTSHRMCAGGTMAWVAAGKTADLGMSAMGVVKATQDWTARVPPVVIRHKLAGVIRVAQAKV